MPYTNAYIYLPIPIVIKFLFIILPFDYSTYYI